MRVRQVYKILNQADVRCKVEKINEKEWESQLEELTKLNGLIGFFKDGEDDNAEVRTIYMIEFGGVHGNQRWLNTILVSKHTTEEDIHEIVHTLWKEKLDAKFNG